jgi:hypothetical protein
MNRKQRRLAERKGQKNRQKFEAKFSNSLPTTEQMKQVADRLRGNGEDIELMKDICLSNQLKPEPIHILVHTFDEDFFRRCYDQQETPMICIVQEEDGTFSRVFANQMDWTEMADDLEFKMGSLSSNTKLLTQEILNIELIKTLNFTYEELGIKLGNLRMLDVGVHIFSKMSGEKIVEQGEKFNNYFEAEYYGMRNLFYQGILTGEEAEKLSPKVGA